MKREEQENYLRDLPQRLAAHLEGGAAHRREEIERAIGLLKKERWSLYMRLVAPYLCDDPRPELVEAWRSEAPDSVASKVALADLECVMDLGENRIGMRIFPVGTMPYGFPRFPHFQAIPDRVHNSL